MGKRIWLSRNPRNLGSDKIVRTKYVSISTPSCKQDSNFAFYPRVLVVNRIHVATLAFKEKTTTTKLILSSDLNFHVYINVHNRERARARDKKQRRPISS